MAEPHVVILGAGPAGVGAAFQLRRLDRARVTVIEQGQVPGGNAGSFEVHGQRLDYGSHRLHPACDPALLADIRTLLGDDLLDRPRHGRIHLRGRWIHFPLKPADLFLRLDRGFAVGTIRDMVAKAIGRRREDGESFASVLLANLGPTICHEFYFPYGRKIWGEAPERLSAIQARRRVSAGSFGKLLRKVLNQVPGFKPPGVGRFFYPRQGFGQISEAFAHAALERGAQFRMGWRMAQLHPPLHNEDPWRVVVEREGQRDELLADEVWSTLPISILARAVSTGVPPAVTEAAAKIQYRSMLLVYLELDVDQFTEFDAHYFPGADIHITRLSEPKNYAARTEPRGSTTLCAELPCSPSDPWWKMSDRELGQLVADDLAQAGIPLPRAPVMVHTKRLPHAYPIYHQGYEVPFGTLDAWADSMPRLLTFGRQGLFAHDNTHHALAMAYGAVDCLGPNGFDRGKWLEYRTVFATHVVED